MREGRKCAPLTPLLLTSGKINKLYLYIALSVQYNISMDREQYVVIRRDFWRRERKEKGVAKVNEDERRRVSECKEVRGYRTEQGVRELMDCRKRDKVWG